MKKAKKPDFQAAIDWMESLGVSPKLIPFMSLYTKSQKVPMSVLHEDVLDDRYITVDSHGYVHPRQALADLIDDAMAVSGVAR